MSHNPCERPHGWWCRIVSRLGDDMSMSMAEEGRTLVRRAAGDTNGLTVAAQIRKSARALGYPADSWRVREAWYGRASSWSAQAMRDLQDAYGRWLERDQARLAEERARQSAGDRAMLQSIRARHLAEVARIEARLRALGGDDPG